jgi:uncharacterized membrane protein YdjX (TVP38/TMEM64 family)
VEGLGLLGPLAFFLAEAAQVIFALLPGGLLPPVGALAFGPWAAFALAMGGCTTGSTVVFALARRCGRPLVQRLLTPQTLDRYTGVFAGGGAGGNLWLFLVFAIPVFPCDAVCPLAGLSSISFRRFITVSTLGRMAATALTILLAAQLSTAPTWATLIAALTIAAALALALAYRSRVEAWLLRRKGAEVAVS